jgi:hypothetical protein
VPCLSRMCSQDEFCDFATPQDQPVVHMSYPRSPSPIKKRPRTTVNTKLNPFPLDLTGVPNLTKSILGIKPSVNGDPNDVMSK